MKNKICCTILATLSLILSACNKQGTTTEQTHGNIEIPLTGYKSGKLVYTVKVNSPDSNEINTFYHFNPASIEMYFSGNKFRMIEYGGLSYGNILLNNETKEVFQLDTLNKIAYRGVYSDLASADAKLRELMPDHFAPTMEPTDNIDTILGFPCRQYKILRSGFIRSQNDTYMWVTDSIQLPPARYDIETPINKVITPLPLIIGYSKGTVLRLTYQVDEMEIAYEVSDIQLEKVDSSFFTIPEDYEIK